MNQAQEVLLVEVFQVRVVVLQGQVFGDLPVATGIPELVAVLGCAGDGQAGAVARCPAHGMGQLTRIDSQVVDFFRLYGAAFKRLRQQTTIVGNQDWQVRCQSATEVSFGLGEARFSVGAETTPLAYCRFIGVAWEEAAVIRVVTFTAIQMNAPQRLCIDTETHSTFSETRDVVELEALTGFTVVFTAFTVIGIVIHGPRTERQLVVLNETGGIRLLGQNPYGHGECQGRLVHVLLLYVSNSCVSLTAGSIALLDVDWRLAPKRDRQVNRNHSFHDFGLMRQPLGSRIMTIL
ncbi:hypothetical protein D9M71_426280 [compost metagenome]